MSFTEVRAASVGSEPITRARGAAAAFTLRLRSHLHGVARDARYAWSIPAVRLGVLATCLITFGSFTPAFLPPGSQLPQLIGLGWLQSGGGRAVATVAVLAGVALLLFAWLSVRPALHRRGGARKLPTAAWWLWSLPLAVAPPLFSRDAYSYAAQGLIVDRGMDPYTTGPISVPGPYADQVDPMWLYTSAPYGPLALQTQHLVVDLTFGNAYLAAMAMRIPAWLSVAIIAYVLPRLARRLGVSASMASWIGVLNPLVLLHLVGGAHNDAMAIALAVVALYLATDGRLFPACLAIAAAAGYKQTAMLAMVGVAGLIARRMVTEQRLALAGSDRRARVDIVADRREGQGSLTVESGPGDPAHREYLRTAVKVGALSLLLFALITAWFGMGWGWVNGLSGTVSVRSLLSPSTLLGSVAQLAMLALGASPEMAATALTASNLIGYGLMVVALGWITVWLAPRRPALATVAAFAAFVLGGSVVHAWYVLPVFVFAGLVRLNEQAVRVLVAVTMFLGAYAAFDVAVGNGAFTVAMAVAAGLLLRLRHIGVLSFSIPGLDGKPARTSALAEASVRQPKVSGR